ncbi:hypothetical protein FDECE_5539 [Fusarium decemcellulare]|nr:hypothetical protein FDECE_5539 [Fusarium decemcellulare]
MLVGNVEKRGQIKVEVEVKAKIEIEEAWKIRQAGTAWGSARTNASRGPVRAAKGAIEYLLVEARARTEDPVARSYNQGAGVLNFAGD